MRGSSLALVFVAAFSGCLSPDEYREQADRESYDFVARARLVAGQAPEPDFTIEPPAERLRHRFLLPPEDDAVPGPKERLVRSGERVTVDLATAIAIAARNGREFQTEKERLYQAALALTGRLNDFETQYFSVVSLDGAANGDGDDDTTLSVVENGSFGFTRMLERGGQLALTIGQDLTRFFTNPADTLATAFVNLSLSLPLLRGAGREIAYENVVQAERDVVYAVRTFERFKRQFGVRVISEYLRLLQSLQTVDNERRNYERRQQTAIENRALGEAGRLARTDVERANQAELSAENRWIVAQQNHENDLDSFKLTLGLPPDAPVAIARSDLELLAERGFDDATLSEEDAMLVALGHRLDLAVAYSRVADARRRVVVAADALRAGLDFTASAQFDTNDFANESFRLDPVGDADYSLGLLLDLPLERTQARNAYRQALISYEVAKRDAEELEDRVKLQVRQGLRDLELAKETHRIQVRAREVAETNVEAATLLKEAGEGTTLDLLDAQNDLVAAQNAVIQALVNYYITRLELLRDLGVLVVTPKGIDEEATRRLLAGES